MDPAEVNLFFEEIYYFDFLLYELEDGAPDPAETLREILAVEAWLKDRPWVSHTVPYLPEVQERWRKLRSHAVPSTNPFMGTRLARGGPRSLKQRSAVGGRGRSNTLAPVKPAHRHHPPAVVLYAQSGGVFWGPRNLKGFPLADCGPWREGIPSRSQCLQQHAHRDQPPPVPTGSQSPVPRLRLSADVSLSSTSVVLTAASVSSTCSSTCSSRCSAPEAPS
ncbi:unnamed protein product [Pleuronectes platessa]|uniref:Uncharacterized protein n=1 Tax=Pleuronectes platessa TaxID=8262 RepID=A0A9N7Y9X2_PLEPL|nr:unnamed protein product [Pleuronectes platessa]